MITLAKPTGAKPGDLDIATTTPQATVLVVEDEPLVRMTAIDIIEDAGFIALEAADADEAIAILEAHPEIRIVFTDIEMPGSINGLKLAAFIRDRWPPIEIVVTSGRIRDAEQHLPPGGVYIPKPYRAAELAETLHRLAA